MMKPVLILLMVLLAACEGATLSGPTAQTGAPPIVRATDRGTAMLTLIACPIQTSGGAILAEMIRDLQAAAPIVSADARGTARLVLNTCAAPPNAEMITALGTLNRRPR